MHRYSESHGALTKALAAMVEEGDTLLIALISEPLEIIAGKLASAQKRSPGTGSPDGPAGTTGKPS